MAIENGDAKAEVNSWMAVDLGGNGITDSKRVLKMSIRPGDIAHVDGKEVRIMSIDPLTWEPINKGRVQLPTEMLDRRGR